MATEDVEIGGDVTMVPEVDEIGWDVNKVATDVDEIVGDVVIWPPRFMSLDEMS